MKVKVKNIQGSDVEELEVQFPVIEDSRGEQALHDAVVAHRAAQRSGTACTRTRSEVAGHGKKPWRQKGTGRARHGSIRTVIWRGGGVVFGPRPRDFRKKLNSKTRSLALRKALSERLKSGEVTVVDNLSLEAPKTKAFVQILSDLKLGGTTLLVTTAKDQNIYLSSRNVAGVATTTSDSLNSYEVLRYDHLLFSRDAFSKVESRLSK